MQTIPPEASGEIGSLSRVDLRTRGGFWSEVDAERPDTMNRLCRPHPTSYLSNVSHRLPSGVATK